MKDLPNFCVMLIYIIGAVAGTLNPIHHWYQVLIIVAGWYSFTAVWAILGRLTQRRRKVRRDEKVSA